MGPKENAKILATAALGVVWACGSPTATPDAMSDSATLTVGSIRLTVRTAFGNPPSAGVHVSSGTDVVFTDSNQQTQVVTTDASGVATAVVTGPTTITHLQAWGTIDEAMTIFGAEPGDDLLLELPNDDYTELAPISVTFTAVSNTSYQACGPCGCRIGVASPLLVPMNEFCKTSPATIVLVAKSGNSGTYVSNTTTYDPSAGSTIALSPTTPLDQHTGTFTNIPPDISILSLDFAPGAIRAQKPSPSAMESLLVLGWRGLPTWFSTSLGKPGYSQYVIDDVDPNNPGLTVDMQSTLLPWLGDPTLDATTGTFSAPSLPGAVVGDLYIGTLAYGRTDGRGMIWTVIASAPGDFQIPVLPASVGDLTPAPNGMGSVASYVFAFDSVDGYPEARRDALGLWRSIGTGSGSGRRVFGKSINSNSPYIP